MVISVAAIGDAPADELTLQLVFVLFLMARYLIKLLILFIYFALGRIKLFTNRVYLSIDNRLTSSVGYHPVVYWEVVLSIVVSIGMFVGLGTTQLNVYVQFLLIFTVINLLSFVWQSLRNTVTIKN